MSGASVLFDSPGPRAQVRNHIATVATVIALVLIGWAVLAKLADRQQLVAAKWTPFLTADGWRTYVIPGIEGTSSEYLTLAGVVTGLTLYNGAVIAEIVRAGVNALPRGQSEAASALGLRWRQTMRSILLPQAITSMLPVLVSQLVVVLKDTALGVAITYPELVSQGQNIGAWFSNYFPALIFVASLMIAVNFGLSSFAVWLEGRLRRSERGPAPLKVKDVEQEGAPGAKVV